jgi:hypothetical protein
LTVIRISLIILDGMPDRGVGRVAEVPLLEIASEFEQARVLLVGELHGTVECPAVFGDLVFAAARRGPVHVGVDLPSTEQNELDHFLANPDDAARRARWLARPLFTTRVQDGRTSRAMVALLDRIARYRAQGMPIEVFAFDAPATADADEQRDLRMARMIADRARDPARRVLALMGNVHNQLDPTTPWAPDFRTVAMHLRDMLADDDLRSLTLDWVTGTAWHETDQGVGEQISNGFQIAPVGSVVIDRERDGSPWRHAIINLGVLHASPPAVSPARA